MNYWWVNQNQTYDHEVGGGYLWSPKRRSDGSRNRFYDNMTEVRPGDVVFSFCNTLIRAVGIASGVASTAEMPPEFLRSGATWSGEGWLVPVEFTELESPVKPRDYMPVLRPLLPDRYSPLQQTGRGNQGVYLTAVSDRLAAALVDLLGQQVEQVVNSVAPPVLQQIQEDETERALAEREDLTQTEKDRLVKARLGQGLFKARVMSIEKRCRVTGVTNREHLRASHIKPWRCSTDSEKLDGNNGLLLAPHVDHLFDYGYISFSDDGEVLVSRRLDPSVLKRWGLSSSQHVGGFNSGQRCYLAFHREEIFRTK